jgi:hypothetical protein
VSLIDKCPNNYKIIINTLIGGLHQLVYKHQSGYYDSNLEVALASNEHDNNKPNCRSAITTDIDIDNMYFVIIQQETPNYNIGTPVYRQIIEIEHINLENVALCLLFKAPRCIFVAGNTDCWTVVNGNVEYINKCLAIQDTDNVISLLGTVKVEPLIKVNRRTFDEVNEINDAVMIYKPKERRIIKREIYNKTEYNTVFLEDVKKAGSCMVLAGGAGYGKSCLNMILFQPGDVILAPKHKDCTRLVKASKELKERGIVQFELTLNDVRVTADYFTESKTLNEQLRSLSGKGKILVEEVGQVSQMIYINCL